MALLDDLNRSIRSDDVGILLSLRGELDPPGFAKKYTVRPIDVGDLKNRSEQFGLGTPVVLYAEGYKLLLSAVHTHFDQRSQAFNFNDGVILAKASNLIRAATILSYKYMKLHDRHHREWVGHLKNVGFGLMYSPLLDLYKNQTTGLLLDLGNACRKKDQNAFGKLLIQVMDKSDKMMLMFRKTLESGAEGKAQLKQIA